MNQFDLSLKNPWEASSDLVLLIYETEFNFTKKNRRKTINKFIQLNKSQFLIQRLTEVFTREN